MNLRDTYNRIAEDWNERHQDDTWWIETTSKFILLLNPGSLVLDVGCGAGVKSKYLINKGLKVIGIDFSEKMIEIAKRKVPEGKFFVLDLNDIEKLKEKFDGIFVQAVLLHILKSNVANVLRKILAVLKKDGYLYLAVKEKKDSQAEEEIKIENNYGYEYKRFFSYFTQNEIRDILEKLKMRVVNENITSSGKNRWIQVIAKNNEK